MILTHFSLLHFHWMLISELADSGGGSVNKYCIFSCTFMSRIYKVTVRYCVEKESFKVSFLIRSPHVCIHLYTHLQAGHQPTDNLQLHTFVLKAIVLVSFM